MSSTALHNQTERQRAKKLVLFSCCLCLVVGVAAANLIKWVILNYKTDNVKLITNNRNTNMTYFENLDMIHYCLTNKSSNCSCNASYTGLTCELFHHCTSKPCKHDGSCVRYSKDAFICFCKRGATGKFCESDVDECASNPCYNGGICKDQFNAFKCQCANGTSSTYCDLDINECAQPNICNSGLCKESKQVGKFECICPLNVVGEQCEHMPTPLTERVVGQQWKKTDFKFELSLLFDTNFLYSYHTNSKSLRIYKFHKNVLDLKTVKFVNLTWVDFEGGFAFNRYYFTAIAINDRKTQLVHFDLNFDKSFVRNLTKTFFKFVQKTWTACRDTMLSITSVISLTKQFYILVAPCGKLIRFNQTTYMYEPVYYLDRNKAAVFQLIKVYGTNNFFLIRLRMNVISVQIFDETGNVMWKHSSKLLKSKH